jgi:hypothetical protein
MKVTTLYALFGLATFTGCGGGTNTEGENPGECSDNIDNDSDGQTDCFDPGCSQTVECLEGEPDPDPDPTDTGEIPSDTGGGGTDSGEEDTELLPYFGDITFYSEESMTEFCKYYDRIYGSVTISRRAPSTSNLGCIKYIDGDLDFGFGTEEVALLSTVEFSNLEQISGDLYHYAGGVAAPINSFLFPELKGAGSIEVSGLTELISLDFSELKSVDHHFQMTQLGKLYELDLKALEYVGGYLNVSYAEHLTFVDLSALTFVGQTFSFSYALLTDLDWVPKGLPKEVGYFFAQLENLEDVDGLSHLREVASIGLRGNHSLVDVQGLANIAKVSGKLSIIENCRLDTGHVWSVIETIGVSNIAEYEVARNSVQYCP